MEKEKNIVEEFTRTREELNKIVMDRADNVIKRFYSLDSQAYRDGVINSKIKEMLGLVSSLVLRCDDCVKYHLNQCFEKNVNNNEIVEVLEIGLIVGGSIVIPHLRRAMEFWIALENNRFGQLFDKIKEEIEKKKKNKTKINEKMPEKLKTDLMQEICEICTKHIPYYNWFGFYLVDNKEKDSLVLGPYVGEPTEHVKIAFGQGICGQAAEKKDTIIVDDVSAEKNYLSCSLKVKSELVVPIKRDNLILGEIDIDSHFLNAFSELDKIFIEKLAGLVSTFI